MSSLDTAKLLRWLPVVVLVLATTHKVLTIDRLLTYPHSWATAQAAVEARAYVEIGVRQLKGVPYPNHQPLGLHPQGYVRWPPLPSLLLGGWFRVWGDSETTLHSFSLVLYLVTAATVWWMLLPLGRTSAAMGLFAWAVLPVTVQFSQGVYHEFVALPCAMLAVGSFLRRSGRGAIWMALAMLCSWEFITLPVGMLVVAGRKKHAAAYLGAALTTAALVFCWYTAVYPDSLGQTIAQSRYRLGIAPMPVNGPMDLLESWVPKESRLGSVPIAAGNMAAQISLSWLIVALAWRLREKRAVLCALLAPPIMWFVVFPSHIAIHEFLAILVAPAVAYAAAVILPTLRPWHLCAAVLLLAIPLLRSLHGLADRSWMYEPDDNVRLGRVICERTPPLSVVLTSNPSGVPVYYSHRHLIGGVTSDEVLQTVLPAIRARFPETPIFLASPNGRGWSVMEFPARDPFPTKMRQTDGGAGLVQN